jgi:formylmethanofuran dehydrogenase subunit E
VKEYNKNNKDHIKEYNKEYIKNNKEQIKEQKKEWYKNNAKYETYKDKLTIDEDSRLSEDGISIEVKCRYCGKYFIPTNQQVRNRIQALSGTSAGEHSLYCSDGCKQECPIYNQTK